jgi:hypothetical protein
MANTATPFQTLTVNKTYYSNHIIPGKFFLTREYQWLKNGTAITGEIAPIYSVDPSDVGSTISCKETVYRVPGPNDGNTVYTPSSGEKSISYSDGISIISGSSLASGLLSKSSLAYVGSFALPNPNPSGNSTAPYFEASKWLQGGGSSVAVVKYGGVSCLIIGGAQTYAMAGIVSIPSDVQLSNAYTTPANSYPVISTLLKPTDYLRPVFENKVYFIGATASYDAAYDGLDGTGFPPVNYGYIPSLNYPSKFYATATRYYGGWETSLFYRRPVDVTTTGQIEGAVFPQDITKNIYNSRFFTGYGCIVPVAYRASLSADILIGLCGPAGASSTSQGPSIYGFLESSFATAIAKIPGPSGSVTSGSVGSGSSVNTSVNAVYVTLDSGSSGTNDYYKGWWFVAPGYSHCASRITAYNGTTKIATIKWDHVAEGLVGGQVPSSGTTYKLLPPMDGNLLAGYGLNTTELFAVQRDEEVAPLWDYCNSYKKAMIAGMCFPSGSKSILVFGISKTGPWTYNSNNELIPSLNNGKIFDSQDTFTRGPHVFPTHQSRVYGFNADDLIAVKNGTKNYYDVAPYAVWTLPMPYSNPLNGFAFDIDNGRAYLMDTSGPYGGIVHVYQVTV